jgi:hypothetical protein
MVNHILDLDYDRNETLLNLFKTIASGNTILFLGAGASVTGSNKFLSTDIIEFYEDKKNINLGISDITEFVDTLASTPSFRRDEFDNYVDQCLRKLTISKAHLTIAKVPWREIITTNFDLLLEGAFAQLDGTYQEANKLKIVHNTKQYNSIIAKDEVKYIKLHGCISSKKEYKLVFSSDDFKKAKKFYKPVLEDLKNITDRINFLSVGYSYRDAFAKKLLEDIDKYNFRDSRVLFNVDPFVNEATLPLYASKNICIIKATIEEFFQAFENWISEKDILFTKAKKRHYTNSQEKDIYIPAQIQRRVGEDLKQLNSYYRSRIIPESEYFKGEEPDYSVILKNYDVIKTKKLGQIKDEVIGKLETPADTRLIPIFFLTGTFGTGKSTFAYRLINELNKTIEESTSFEVIDPANLDPVDLKEIFSKSGSKYIFIYVDSIEINSVFASFKDLRNALSLEMTPDIKMAFITTIRENIYLRYKEEKTLKNSFAINIDCKFDQNEIEELINKLKDSGVISYRDLNEKKQLLERVKNDLLSDSYLSILEIVQGNRLIDDLLEAFYQLPKKCQTAFIYTSILYQYKILMPAGLLRSLVGGDWQKFRQEVIEKDGKGILIQERVESNATEPDLYFRTKHPVISSKLINALLKKEDERFTYIKSVVTHISSGLKNSRLLVNFLKALFINKDINVPKLNNLYDLADQHLSDDVYFLIFYTHNLQRRESESDINYAIEKIIYAESISEYSNRNHYLIHRRGVLLFELAKVIYRRQDPSEVYKVLKYLGESRDFLEIKKTLDPFSSFSYYDLINLEIWCLSNLDEDTTEKFRRRIRIEELIDIALKAVYEYENKIYEIKNVYVKNFMFDGNEDEYISYLKKYYQDSGSRAYALILLFNYYFDRSRFEECEIYLSELETITYNNEAVKLLLKYYGRNLAYHDKRIKYFDLVRNHPELEDTDRLRVVYFNFVAECYNKNFGYALNHLKNIRERFTYINPDFKQVWIDDTTNKTALFEATLRLNRSGKKTFYIPELGLWAKCENWDSSWQLKMNFDVEIHFYIYGIRAKAINVISDEFEDESEIDESNELEL